MIEGTYAVSASTPVGVKRGEASFTRGADGALKVSLKVKGLNIVLSRAKVEGDAFELAGTISHLLLGKAPFTCSGRVEGDTLTATASSGSVSISLAGTRK